jgi:hypothetical protein
MSPLAETTRRHGLGKEGVAALLLAQGNACAICGTPERDEPGHRLAVDHDHGHCPGQHGCRECVRGLICIACNNLLRSARDNPVVLRAAIEYLHARGVIGRGTAQEAP